MNHFTTTLRKLTGAAAIAVLVVLAPPETAPVAQAQAVAPQLSQVVSALRGITTMRANFAQTDRSGRMVRGVLTLQTPGKIRFQYEKGVPLLIVADGSALSFIDYEVKQVQRWPIRSTPLAPLLDPRRDLTRYASLQPTANPNVVSVLARDRSHPEYGAMTLIFVRKASAPGGLELSHWVMVDSQNKQTTVQLSDHRYGVPVAANAFRFNDPRTPSRR